LNNATTACSVQQKHEKGWDMFCGMDMLLKQVVKKGWKERRSWEDPGKYYWIVCKKGHRK